MPALKNKTILILSPQSWGKMFVSKHHYAVELARYGNTVYFLNPPEQEKNKRSGIDIESTALHPDLYIIHHRLSFPYNLKFRFMPLFHFLMKRHIKKILQAMEHKPDIIWSFDLGNLYPFRFFPEKAIKIFHPVDEPLNKTALQSARGAQFIFSVTREILEKYSAFSVPKHFINHGVSEVFLKQHSFKRPAGDPVRVGFSGNFLRPDIDRPVLLQIITENSEIIFECWGSYEVSQSNIAGSDDKDTREFIASLKAATNVILHGPVSSERLAEEMQQMDVFLICYDILKDQSGGTNYHKVMEYLSNGKVIISNNITTYKDENGLIEMVSERDSNYAMPKLFGNVVNNLNYYNNAVHIAKRISFARQNLYLRQIERIELFIINSSRK
jgi:glycosyltransferase involved in cell wall biosynthesis